MKDNELIDLTTPHYAQLEKQGALRDSEVIDDKQLQSAQKPIATAANIVVSLRLKQEYYRALWEYSDTLKLDNWAHKDKVKQMKRDRKEERIKAKAARKEQRKTKQTALMPAVSPVTVATNINPTTNATAVATTAVALIAPTTIPTVAAPTAPPASAKAPSAPVKKQP